jgi:hypothetical protein
MLTMMPWSCLTADVDREEHSTHASDDHDRASESTRLIDLNGNYGRPGYPSGRWWFLGSRAVFLDWKNRINFVR